ncbi:hypothetical protein HPB52_024206 [Rhipicephalus sanguineus]|uniref:CCHC-type domain-containing protein n=1 Tax=Rhipicephalus sanguineus TaxID=34632 RepID=A0A9D4YRA3_RHISA|nr:hypothetical protein HPB52_024206 [Rhipicephalus sanguineus]
MSPPFSAYETNAYESAPDLTSKGVIRGIPLEDSPRDITAQVLTPKNPTAIAAKRLSNTTNVIVLFSGLKVPTFVRYGGALIKCALYRKQLDLCHQCGRLGHRMDVCPSPQDRVCRGCGTANPGPDHQCNPCCQLCGGEHYNGRQEMQGSLQDAVYCQTKTMGKTATTGRTPSLGSYEGSSWTLFPGGRPSSRARARSRTRQSRSRSRTPLRPDPDPGIIRPDHHHNAPDRGLAEEAAWRRKMRPTRWAR